jgi:hypothetical protein
MICLKGRFPRVAVQDHHAVSATQRSAGREKASEAPTGGVEPHAQRLEIDHQPPASALECAR